jgi:hypothetical protein
MFDYVPSEISIGGVYFPPLLLAGIWGMILAWLTAILLNRYRLSRFFAYPPVVFTRLLHKFAVLGVRRREP